MKALILAAGRGKRLWPLTANQPKCLLDVGGTSILEHQLASLESAGIRRVVLVCGFGVDRIRQKLDACRSGLHVRILYNPFYAVADNLVSLWAARADMDEDFLLLNGDNVFHPEVLETLISDTSGTCLMIHRKATYDDDDMKVELDGDSVRRISKDLPLDLTHSESIGIMRFAGAGVLQLHRTLEEVVMEETALGQLFVEGVQRLVDKGYAVAALDVGDLPWADVDTQADLAWVRSHVHLFRTPSSSPGLPPEGAGLRRPV